uniref:Uncharacterized protein n=1 Tax=Arundo donax TaxID=35708 RepID=A0A0A9HN06_ARUDO
MQTSGDLPVV